MQKQYKNFPFAIPGEKEKTTNLSDGSEVEERDHSADMVRPTMITVLCGYFFVSWCLGAINMAVLLSRASNISYNFSILTQPSVLIGLAISIVVTVAIFGYWFMRKWGVYLYTIIMILNFVYLISEIGFPSSMILLGFLLPAVMIFVGFTYLKRMS